jgi:glyoxylase-like metal-dependent hydrolase (beta-lactamase superfamily II)
MIDLCILTVGEFESNCYLLVGPGGKRAVLIDPGDQPDDILHLVEPRQVTQILITHGHLDHVGGLETVRRALGAPVGIHPADAEAYDLQPDFFLEDGDSFNLEGERLEIVHIPGHTPGSVALRMIEQGQFQRAIVGDAIFPGGPGYTATPQDLATSMDSLARTVFTWDDEVVLYPGHGGPTTIGAERADFESFSVGPLPPDLCGDVTWY